MVFLLSVYADPGETPETENKTSLSGGQGKFEERGWPLQSRS